MYKKNITNKILLVLIALSISASLLSCSNFNMQNETDSPTISIDKQLDATTLSQKLSSYPRVDGSTANMPMMAQIKASFLGIDLVDAENSIDVTTTDYAWRSLLDHNSDLLLVYEPSSETKEMIEKSDTKLLITPIGLDALVFLSNEENKVSDIKSEDLQSIYTGDIKNWSEIGGDDTDIIAFQRPLNSGSQTLFLNLLMKDKKPVDPPIEYIPYGMGDLIESIASYKNENSALGFSVYYYAKKMYEKSGVKILSVDGVLPTDSSISDRSYPFLNEYYLVIREDTDKDSETYKLYEYILSSAGKKDMIKAGYIPVS